MSGAVRIDAIILGNIEWIDQQRVFYVYHILAGIDTEGKDVVYLFDRIGAASDSVRTEWHRLVGGGGCRSCRCCLHNVGLVE